PILWLDVAPMSHLEREFIRALAHQTGDILATAHARDDDSVRAFAGALNVAPAVIQPGNDGTALERLRRHVFEIATPPPGAPDPHTVFPSATDETREWFEIARSILAAARTGIPFDRMAVLLRNPALSQPLLEDAFRRAGIPAFFTRGSRRPNPGGRAFLTLLACASEKLSASRFSEYLSLAQIPHQEQRPAWVTPQGELVSVMPARSEQDRDDASAPDSDSRVIAGTLRSPRHWERLLVDAAVIGGYDRWVRRLDGLARELQARIQELGAEEEPVRSRVEQDLA